MFWYLYHLVFVISMQNIYLWPFIAVPDVCPWYMSPLAPGRNDFRLVISKLIIVKDDKYISGGIVLRWMSFHVTSN